MKRIGSLMFFLGVGSAVLHFADREFILLMWIDAFGPTMAWVIRGAMALVGAFLWLTGADPEAESD
ncbi:hypothetical protein ACFSW8_05650 [Rubritalea tangerina]|uniref:DUF378 domain-containing protein n=1 Tax=Rubritalea tangerina TaxID=430798 RepID=A0ABW4Z8R7_9BACT